MRLKGVERLNGGRLPEGGGRYKEGGWSESSGRPKMSGWLKVWGRLDNIWRHKGSGR